MKKMRTIFLQICLLLLVAVSTSFATPVIYNNTIPAGTSAFDTLITSVGGTVNTDTLSGLSSGTSWDRGDYTITATNGISRGIDNSYLVGQSIVINPASPANLSGLTFTFDTPVNAFGLEIGDWATCCYLPSGLYISFDGGSNNLVANAYSSNDNPGYVAGLGYENFIGAIDDTSTFSTVTFYGDGFGEYLVAGGTIRWATVEEGSVSGQIPEPATMFLFGCGLLSLAGLTRKKS